jgi:hexosaminidase
MALAVLGSVGSVAFGPAPHQAPPPMEVGNSIGIKNITAENMAYAKSVGIASLQIGLNQLVGADGNLKYSDAEIEKMVAVVKAAVDNAGLKVAAFHMPFGQHMDLSLIDEAARQHVVAINKKLLVLCAPLKPAIVLFHPSWYLSLHQREQHITQLVASVKELDPAVKSMGATMVIENMTGPKLYVMRKGVQWERPLCRTVTEMMQIMALLPADVGGAVDMNHILHPEKLVLALGARLKFIHVSDGDGEHEYHYLPCNGKGMNDWDAILSALYKVGYAGPFMFECHYQDMRELATCYRQLYRHFVEKQYP